MKKIARILALLAAAAVLGMAMVSCDYWKEDWYDGEKSENAPLTGSTSSGSVTYTGSLSVNGTTYTSLSMTGSSSSGNALLSGSAGSVSGTYSASGTSRAASTLNLSGTYTLSFSFGTITAVISSNTATLSAGSVSASGTASVASSSSSSSSSSTGASGSGAVLFWDGYLQLEKVGSSSPAAGITEYRFTACTKTEEESRDVTSLCGTYRWYIGGEEEIDPNPYTEFEMDGGHVDQLFYKYKEITVPGITVTPSADTRSCTVTVNSAELPSWSERPNNIRIVVVDWTTPQGMTGSDNVNSDTFEMKKANYDNDIVYSDWGISRPIVDVKYNSERSATSSLGI